MLLLSFISSARRNTWLFSGELTKDTAGKKNTHTNENFLGRKVIKVYWKEEIEKDISAIRTIHFASI